MDQNNIRIAAIGCGDNATIHGRRLSDLPSVSIVGLCDVSDASLDRYKAGVGGLDAVPTFTDHGRMLESIRPDAVLISTPHTLHYRQIVDSLEAGAHVLCEKPLVCSIADARGVMEAEKRADRVVLIAYHRHLEGPYMYGRHVVRTGQLGEIRFVACRLSQNWIQMRDVTPTPWRLDPALSGGGELVDSGAHMLDAMLWLTDLQVEEVYAYQDNCGLQVDVQTAATCKFANGALGTLAVLGDSRGRGWSVYDEVTVYGEYGELSISTERGVMRRDGDADLYRVPEEAMPTPDTPDRVFVELITGRRKENPTPPVCGLRMAELAETLYRSVELGAPVKVASLTDS
jgi:predicted dehydrogenase